MGAMTELFDAWADLVHGSVCLGCGMPGRAWCRSCSGMLDRWVEPRDVDFGVPALPGACAGEYEGWVRDMILAHKERSAWALATPLGTMLALATRSLARAGWLGEADAGVLLVPVPSRRRTVRIRGHDPALRMTRAAACALRARGLPARAAPLLRVRLPVRDSVGLSAAERQRNLDDAFAVTPRANSVLAGLGAPTRIVVCDDVTTTGATVREACAALALRGLSASGAVTVAAVHAPEQNSQANT